MKISVPEGFTKNTTQDLFFFKDFIYLFMRDTYREREREREREEGSMQGARLGTR